MFIKKTVYLLFSFMLSQQALGLETPSPRFQARLANGVLQNHGFAGKTTLMLGAPNITYIYPLNTEISLTFGSDLIFDSEIKEINLWGLHFGIIYSLLGVPGRLHFSDKDLQGSSLSKTHAFVGFETRRYSYFFDQLSSNTDFTTKSDGSFFSMHVKGGFDYRFTSSLEFSTELSYAPLVFSSSDKRVRISVLAFVVGLGWCF